MFGVLQHLLDVICSDWKKRLVGFSSDGAPDMTGPIQNLATRVQKVVIPGFVRVWCCSHQLDLVMKEVFSKLCDYWFLKSLTALIGHLRRQKNFTKNLISQCPRFAETRWSTMGRTLPWLKKHRSAVICFLSQKTPQQSVDHR